MRNGTKSDNTLQREALEQLRRRLPSKWTATLSESQAGVVISAPDKRRGEIALLLRDTLAPKDVQWLSEKIGMEAGTTMVVSSFLSESTRARLRGSNIGYLDLTGNAHVVLPEPGLFLDTAGAAENPNRLERPARTLRGPKAGRIVRVLIESARIPGVRELATLTRTDAGYVSRVLDLLESEALIRRGGRRIQTVDWLGLLRRWAQEAPLDKRGRLCTFLDPRGLLALQARLAHLQSPYAITGSLAAETIAPLAPTRLAMLWVPDAGAAAKSLGLRPAEAGANVVLAEAMDDDVFAGLQQQGELWYTRPTQIALDLLTSPGRGPQEGEEMLDWMRANEGKWRR